MAVYEGTNHPVQAKGERKGYYPSYVQQQIDTIVPRLVIPDFDFDLRPAEPTDEPQVRAFKSLLQYQQDLDDLAGKQIAWASYDQVCGVAFAKVVWANQTETFPIKRKLNPLQRAVGMPEEEVITRVTRDDPTAIVVDPFSLKWDPAATSDSNWRYVCHESWLTPTELRSRAEAGLYPKEAVEELIDYSSGEGSYDTQRFDNEESEEAKARRRDGRILVVELWEPNRLLVVGGGCIVLKDRDNPFWHKKIPFCAVSTAPKLGSLVGYSTAERLEPIQDFLWDVVNQRINGVRIALNPTLLVRRGLKDGNKFKVTSGGRIFVDRPDDIQQLQINPQAMWGDAEEGKALGMMQQISGASPYLAGMDGSTMGVQQDTATGISILQQEANKRMALKLHQLQLFYGRVTKFFIQLDQQFVDSSRAIKIVGPMGEEIKHVGPQEIAGMYDIRVKGAIAESMNREIERQSASELLNVVTPLHGMPLADGRVVDIEYALRNILRAYAVEPDSFFKAPPPPPMMPTPEAGLGAAPPPSPEQAAPPPQGVPVGQ